MHVKEHTLLKGHTRYWSHPSFSPPSLCPFPLPLSYLPDTFCNVAMELGKCMQNLTHSLGLNTLELTLALVLCTRQADEVKLQGSAMMLGSLRKQMSADKQHLEQALASHPT